MYGDTISVFQLALSCFQLPKTFNLNWVLCTSIPHRRNLYSLPISGRVPDISVFFWCQGIYTLATISTVTIMPMPYQISEASYADKD